MTEYEPRALAALDQMDAELNSLLEVVYGLAEQGMDVLAGQTLREYVLSHGQHGTDLAILGCVRYVQLVWAMQNREDNPEP